jgi:Divergent InlB B-repeat domain
MVVAPYPPNVLSSSAFKTTVRPFKRLACFAVRWALAPLSLLLLTFSFPQQSAANIIYVTTLKDEIGGADGCSLKDAIYSARFRSNMAINGYDHLTNAPNLVTTQCVAGSGDDTIVLPPGQVLEVNFPNDDQINPTGPTATPLITSTITIDGYGATLQAVPICPVEIIAFCENLAHSVTSRLFAVGSSGRLTINNLHVEGFSARAGDGGPGGGGGGMAAGGAIYVQAGGVLVVENSTFDKNVATGGTGGDAGIGGGGSGGGVGGDGSGFESADDCFLPVCSAVGGGGSGYAGVGSGNIEDTSGGPGGLGGGTVYFSFDCGGSGGAAATAFAFGHRGSDAPCPGGGGGGGSWGQITSGDGGNGNYGGGGGGGANAGGNGGNGGFGGGGGAGWSGVLGGTTGGNGGFGGGGGAGPNGSVGSGNAGHGGTFGGSASHPNGGGGAGLGGAIFSDAGNVTIENSTFTANDSVGGRTADPSDHIAGTGEGHGGAIFSKDGSLTILNSTIASNLSTGSGGGVYYYQDPSQPTATFILRNTIIANNGGSDDAVASQCMLNAAVITGGDWRGNLIQNNDSCDYNSGTGTVSSADPLLMPLQNYGGYTPTMAIGENSPALNSADASSSSLTLNDQRGSKRPELGGFDIGAYELCDIDPTVVCKPLQLCFFESLTIGVSPVAGGTTSPSPGTTQQCLDSVVSLVAISNPGYTFTGWSGNVSLPANASTALVMAEPQTVTANFALCNCVVDVSNYVTVIRGPIVLNPISKRYAQTITVTNSSASTIIGPVSLVLDNLSANATLFNATGTTDTLEPPAGSPYISASGNLAPGQMDSFSLQFNDPTNTTISYSTRVLAGPGQL